MRVERRIGKTSKVGKGCSPDRKRREFSCDIREKYSGGKWKGKGGKKPHFSDNIF